MAFMGEKQPKSLHVEYFENVNHSSVLEVLAPCKVTKNKRFALKARINIKDKRTLQDCLSHLTLYCYSSLPFGGTFEYLYAHPFVHHGKTQCGL